MAPAFVQSKGGTSNTLSSLPIAYTSNNAAGNLLVCSGVVNASTIGGLTITDTQGNPWIIALVDTWNSVSTFFMAYAPSCKAGANTVTIAQLGSLISGAISEYSGVSPAASLDVSGFSDSGSGTWTAATSGNVTTRENGELIVAAQGNSTGPASVTLGSGFSNLQNDSGNFVSIESQVQATAGTIAGTFTISASSGACGVLTFVPPTDALPFNVWTPQGNVVTQTDRGNPTALWTTTNATVLTNPCMQMWSGNYGSGTLYYEESLDGLTSWTPYSGNPITVGSGVYFPTVYYDGTTYYLFACPTGAFTSIVLYTSSTPVGPWTSKGTVISPSAGSWDSVKVTQLTICDKIAGVYYGYYNGGAGTGNLQLGLATSTDLINWTKVGTAPAIVAANGARGPGTAAQFMKVNGIYYCWSAAFYNNSQLNTLNFTTLFRWSAPSASGPWTQLTVGGNQVPTYYPAAAADFVDTSTDTGIGDVSMVVQNGNIYMYYDVGVAGSLGKINQAVATGYTPAQLVATYEGVVGAPISGAPQLNLVTLGSDPGTGADANPIGGNWTTNSFVGNALKRASNLIQPALATSGHIACIDYWNAVTWGNDQWASAAVQNLASASNGFGSILRQSTSASSRYNFYWNGAVGASGTWTLSKTVAGSTTSLATGTLTVSVGDTLMLVVNGTNLYCYWNGYLIYAVTDSSLASGNAGLYVQGDTSATTDSTVSAWSGGTFQDAPALRSASISGNAGVGATTVAYSGTASGSVVADSFGNYILPNLVNGSYTITPSLAGYTFSPSSSSQTVSGTNITGVNFTASSGANVYSVPDCRVAPFGPNSSRTVAGTKIYDVQTGSNSTVPGTDSRAAGAPVDCRISPNIPQNSRAPGTYGPGE